VVAVAGLGDQLGPPLIAVASPLDDFPKDAGELAAHLADATDPEAFVFTAPKGGPLRVTGFRARVWRPATRAAGVAIAVAVLKYRLYDIDRIINRSLVYVLLTAALGLCYAVGSLLFVLVAGAGSDPPSWLVAAATLAAAAVFRPARRRIQAMVDRRFNRRRYDATRTIEAFSARLRDEVDLDTLSAELLAVVDQTIEPTTASLWLRPSMERSGHSIH
jgi:hypothetical protein